MNHKNTHVVVCIFASKQYQYYSHCQMKTVPLYNQLCKHFSYCYFKPSSEIIEKFKHKKFFIIRIKNYPICKEYLNIKNKCIIWDIIDTLQHTNPSTIWNTPRFIEGYNMSHIINCPNTKMQEVIETKNTDKKKIHMIPHNWDPRIKKHDKLIKNNETLTSLQIAYLGTPNSKEEEQTIAESPHVINLGRTIQTKDIGKFNACCSLRNADTAFGKPGTKSFVAASLNSIIIASKEEYNVVDLFGEDYPYYLDHKGSTIGERLENTIKYVASTYKKKEWDEACKRMYYVRERTTIENVGLEFKKLILDNV